MAPVAGRGRQGKRLAAARRWAALATGRRRPVDHDEETRRLVEQLKAYGQAAAVPALLASRAAVPREPDVFEVWPENAESVRFFLLCCRQWVIAPLGGYLSLNWQAADIALNRLKPTDPDAIFADLIEMESAALPLLNEPRPRE